MAASFGEQLRLAREARGIALREISEQTRIPTRYLEAIEADEYKRLPGGIFNKSFIKAYARYVGFDEKEALEAYARTAREQGASPDEVVSTPYQPRVYTDGSSTRSPLITLLLTVLILAILSLGVYAALHWYQRRAASQAQAGGQSAAPISNASGPAASQQSANTNSPPPLNNAQGGNNGASTTLPARDLNVQIKAVGEPVWLRVYADDPNSPKPAFAGNLEMGQVKEFTSQNFLKVQCSKDKSNALEISINGRAAKVPFNMKGILAEMSVTKENYEQFLQ
jgi:cytoskeletal protein RodZ